MPRVLRFVDDRPAIWDDLSLAQFLRLPEAKPALEYIDGKVVQKVSPKLKHSAIQGGFLGEFRSYLRPRKLGGVYPELRCTFGGYSLVPDLCVFLAGRLLRDANGELDDDVFLPPDLAIEIISPGQTVKNLSARLRWCVANGVRLGWLLQPRKKRAFVFRPDHEPEILEIGETLTGEGIVPGFELPLTVVFGWLKED